MYHKAEYLASSAYESQWPVSDLPEVIFAGRSNAGKSSLINALTNRKNLAYSGKTPGKTQLLNFFLIEDRVVFVDAPGYGYARRSQNEAIAFGKMMDDYFDRKDKIALAIMIVDSRIGLTKDDLDMKDYLEAHQLRYLIAANKIDKLSNNQLMNNKHKLFKDMDNVVYVSAEKKKNIQEIKDCILEALG